MLLDVIHRTYAVDSVRASGKPEMPVRMQRIGP